MDIAKMLVAICGFSLAVCLICSIGAFSTLRRAIAESRPFQEQSQGVVELPSDVEAPLENGSASLPTLENTEQICERYVIRATNQTVSVYNQDGDLLRMVPIFVDHLPKRDREQLLEGLEVGTWQEVEALLEDLGT